MAFLSPSAKSIPSNRILLILLGMIVFFFTVIGTSYIHPMLMFDSRCVFTVSIACILLMYVSEDDVVDIPIFSDYSTTISNQTSMDEDLSEVVLSNIVISI